MSEPTTASISVDVEVAEALEPPQSPVREALARAALLACLAEAGVPGNHVDSLVRAQEAGVASAAARVFVSFVRSGGGQHVSTARPTDPRSSTPVVVSAGGFAVGNELLADARRAAHHISHLLRADRVRGAEYVRNMDPDESAVAANTGPALPLRSRLTRQHGASNTEKSCGRIAPILVRIRLSHMIRHICLLQTSLPSLAGSRSIARIERLLSSS